MGTVEQVQVSPCRGTHSGYQCGSPECSIVVDDVDEERLRIGPSNSEIKVDSSSPEYASNRIKEFQRIAEGRKIEFARLLEEHAQVIQRLKQIEETDAVTLQTTTSV